jgi:hypothetical protein
MLFVAAVIVNGNAGSRKVGFWIVFIFPAIAAREDVFDALICGELTRLTSPGGGEGPAVHILEIVGRSVN